jgi:hypothetical protein
MRRYGGRDRNGTSLLASYTSHNDCLRVLADNLFPLEREADSRLFAQQFSFLHRVPDRDGAVSTASLVLTLYSYNRLPLLLCIFHAHPPVV